jgi:putative salt-induced outer membrane protein
VNLRPLAKYIALFGIIGLYASSAQAEWQFKGELGLVLARGNTETETINAKADAISETDTWKHQMGFSLLQSTSSNVKTADRYELHGQSNYTLSEQSYALGSLRYEDDEFSPYAYQGVASLGYGYKFYDTETFKLASETGVGYRRAEDRLTRETQYDVIFRGGMNYEQKVTGNTLLYDKLLVEAGSENTFVQNEAGVKVDMSSALALSVAYTIRYNSQINEAVIPVPKNTDQLITANLVFSF